MPNLVESLGYISNAAAQVAPGADPGFCQGGWLAGY